MTKKCILPWIHLQVDSDGSTRPCCNGAKNVATMGNILSDSLITVWNNDNYKQLRKQMIDGLEPEACKP